MDGTILGQGTFQASYSGTNPDPGNADDQAGNQVVIQIPSAADWVIVRNFTESGIAGTNGAWLNGNDNAFIGVEFYWQRGMLPGTAFVKYYSDGTAVLNGDTLINGGFTIYDPTGQQAGSGPLLGAPVATTGTTNATRPVVSTGDTSGIVPGTVIRMSNTGQNDVDGIDMVVSAVTTNTNFTLLYASNALANVPGAVGAAGFYRIVYYPSYWYPKRRVVTDISQAANAVVSTALEHSMTVGQAIRFNIPSVAGMIQLNPTTANQYLYATVVAVIDPYNFVIDTNTLAFTAFHWPTVAQQASSFPTFEPVGENTSFALQANMNQFPQYQGQNVNNANGGVFADATVNTGFYGMILGSGGDASISANPIIGPAGSVHFAADDSIDRTDTMYWVSGKAEFGGL